MMKRAEAIARIRQKSPDVADAIELKQPQRIPYIMHGGIPYAQASNGIRISDAVLDNQLLARSQIETIRRHDVDGSFPVCSAISKRELRENRLVEKDGVCYLVDP
ncbi:MAG: hypothetical protein DRN21_05275, partial [Thermoplasmata archaeon]